MSVDSPGLGGTQKADRQLGSANGRCFWWWAVLLLSGMGLPARPAEWAWRKLTTNAPPTAGYHTRVFWTGHELLVWGAVNPDSSKPFIHASWRWNARTGGIRAMSLSNAPAVPALGGQTAVWTGRYLLVWGGRTSTDPTSDTNAGFLYDPLSDSWQNISTVDAPTRRGSHGAVWTGREMFVWGGLNYSRHGSGYDEQLPSDFGAYDPTANRWRLFGGGSAPVGRQNPHLVYAGDGILMWGGWDLQGDFLNLHNVYFDDLNRLNPETGEWTSLLFVGAPAGRDACATLWTGSEFIVWGGYNGPTYGRRTLLSDGARFRPAENRWLPVAPSSPLGARERVDAVWTGSEVVFWGGGIALAPGASYDPGLNRWTSLGTNGAPAWIEAHNTAWAGDTLLVVGDDVFALGPGGPFGGDLIPDAWQERYFGSQPGVAGPDADPDTDGWPNEWEWRFGTDPDLNSSHPTARIEMDAAEVRISFPDPDPFLMYTLQTTVRVNLPFVAASAPTRRIDGRVSWSLKMPLEDTSFFRVRVTVPAF